MSFRGNSFKRVVSGHGLFYKSKTELDKRHSRKALLKAFFLTSSALAAFAANSILYRFALGAGAIDAVGFTSIRLLSGAISLFLILLLTRSGPSRTSSKGSWPAGLALFLYAVTFSYAYLEMDTGIGALILFGSVQTTIIGISIARGNKLLPVQWIGLVISFAGLVYLLFPGASTPSIAGFLLMSIAGAAWGFYTLLGRGSANPLYDTAYNFIRSIPLVASLAVITFNNVHLTTSGVVLAIVSGAVTSGLGYTIWYSALKMISATQAAVSQLAVPVIAALGGVIIMTEVITLRLAVAAAMILGGIFLVVVGRAVLVAKEPSKA